MRAWRECRAVALIAVLELVAGCVCGRPRFLSVDGPEEFRVIDRSWSPGEYEWTAWPVPTRYELIRPAYRLEATTGAPYPHLAIRAVDLEGSKLLVWDPNQPYLYGGHALLGYAEEGSWTFDVKRDGQVLGSETIQYKVRSRPLACRWNSL